MRENSRMIDNILEKGELDNFEGHDPGQPNDDGAAQSTLTRLEALWSRDFFREDNIDPSLIDSAAVASHLPSLNLPNDLWSIGGATTTTSTGDPPPTSPTGSAAAWIWANPFGNIVQTGTIQSATQNDLWRFVADQSGNYSIAVVGSSSLDSQLRVYDSNGNPLTAIIDSSGNGGAESASLNLSTGNWYYVDVAGFSTTTGGYTLDISGPSFPTHNIAVSGPTYTGSISDTIGYAGDLDYFTVTAPTGTSSLNLSVTPSSGLDTYVELYDSGGHLVKGFNTGGTGSVDISNNIAVTAGATYYVGVSSISSSQTGSYTINADFNPDQVSKPNLTASLTSPPPSSLAPGNSFNIGYALHDITSTSAGKFLATFYISPDPTFGDSNDLALTTISETGLAGNASISGSQTLTLPSTAGNGTWYVALVADNGGGFQGGQVDESNESDNISNIYSFTVTASPAIVTLAGAVTDTNEGGGQPLVFDVNLDRLTTQDITVNYQVGGTATSADYQALTGSVTIAAGSSFASISVYPIADGIPDDNETVIITLTGVSTGGVLGNTLSATGTIHDGTGSGTDDFADSPTDTSAQIGNLSVGASLTGFIGPADADDTYGDKDLFQVSLQQGHTYDIEMKSTSINGHSLPLDIFTIRDGSNFNHVDSTSGISSDTTIAFTADSGGAYYILAGTGGAATDQGGYTISVTDITPPANTADDFPDYPGDNTATTGIQTISMGTSRTGSIESQGDKDVFAVSVKAGDTYQFSLSSDSFSGSNGTLDSTYLTVRDSGDFDTVLAQGGNGSLTTLSFVADHDETLYLRVGAGGNGADIGGYRLAVTDDGITPAVPDVPPDTPPAKAISDWMDTNFYKWANGLDAFVDLQWHALAEYMHDLPPEEGAAVAEDISARLTVFGLAVDGAVIAHDVAVSSNPGETLFVEVGNAIVEAVVTYGGGVLGAFGGPFDALSVPLAGSAALVLYEFVAEDAVEHGLQDIYEALFGSNNAAPQESSSDTSTSVDPAQLVTFDENWYLSTYADAAAAVASGTAGSAYAYFLTLGIDKGEQPNAAQQLTRSDLAVSIINNDPTALGNSALMTQPLGGYVGDGISSYEQAVADGINAGRASVLSLDASLSAIASRKATDLVANFATSAANNARHQTDSAWASRWSNGNALSQQFNAAFSTIFGSDNTDGHYQMFVIASPYTDASQVLKSIESQTGASAALSNAAYNTVGIGEYGGLWVVIVGTHATGYTGQSPDADGLGALTEYGSPNADVLYAGTRAAHLYGMDGNDVMAGGPGDDIFDGGNGRDAVSYAAATGGVYAELAFGGPENSGGGEGKDTLISIENLIGSNYGDSFDDNSSNNILQGGTGNDLLSISYGGNDYAEGEAGNDSIFAGAALTSSDRIDGGTGNDVLSLQGDYRHELRFRPDTMTSVEMLSFNPGFSYKIALDDANVAARKTLTLNAQTLGAADVLNFSGANETDGSFAIYAGAANDDLVGGARNDTFELSKGGDDKVDGGGGNDIFYLASALTSSDRIDGGAGNDAISLDGDYSAGVMLGAKTLNSVETVFLTAGHEYKLTSTDATVAAGGNLTVDGSLLADALTFNGSRETDGHFTIHGGTGANVLAGGSGNDRFIMTSGDADSIQGQGGNDQIWFGAGFSAGDRIDGGAGKDVLILNGDYSGGVNFGSHTLTNVETLLLSGGFSYKFTTFDTTVAAGQALEVDASSLRSSDTLVFNGSKETDGRFVLVGGAGSDALAGGTGNDRIEGGLGADTLSGGGGRNLFVYAGVADSSGSNFDTFKGFDAHYDRLDLPVTITGIDATVTGGGLNFANFDSALSTAIGAGQLAARHAVLFLPNAGSLAGHTFLIVDANGLAGYQAGADFVFDVTGAAHLSNLAEGDFI